ncbi:Na/Pi cotransporter II-related protein [Bosea sp. LC85]|uniref:Na/Pi cotransporter family protein n=1 Tax=Bosea sp. LC85 TaxID=1502851 RepID=UPI0004E45687|nr:Na/Pi cotransporter family protein [Bosea sp. LC85]KFC70994.1 Na/Pi cotransporter II-related protein [Bosea sp. LC85]
MTGQTPTQILLALAGEVALLLWSVQLVTAGVSAAFGSRLRALLATGLDSRWRAFGAGLMVTAGLQSSTATAMMIASFSGAGLIALAPALAMMLGANVGTTLIVQFVGFDTSIFVPLLLLVGYVGMRRFGRLAANEMAKALFGLGLMLLSLRLMQGTMAPVEHSQVLRTVLGALSGDPLIALLLAAVLSFAAHSSLAAILVVMSLAATGVVGTQTMLAMVLGCNLGTALNPLVQALNGNAAARRVPVGNLANRILGCAAGLLLLPVLTPIAERFASHSAQSAALFHLAFNIVMALLFLVPLPAFAGVLTRLLPDPAPEADPSRPRYLDTAALTTPTLALANATREVLHMADVVDAMLKTSLRAFEGDDPARVAEVSRADDVLDNLYNQIQLYVGAIAHETLSQSDEHRLSEVLTLAINLEHIGDIIEKNLMQMAGKRIRDQRRLPEEALARIADTHDRLRDHLRLALTVFISQDEATARRIVREKETFRELEREAIEAHLAEMRTGSREAVIVSALQLDIARDLKRIDAHIAATVHGLLEQRGALMGSRLMRAGE